MIKIKRVLSNLTFTFVSRALELLSGLLITVMLTRYLGLNDFGRYSVLMSIFWVTQPLITLGFPRILVREIVQQREKGPAYILTGWSWNLIMTLLTCCVLLLINGRYGFEQNGSLLLITLAAGVMAMTQTTSSLIIAYERMHYETIPVLTSMIILTTLIALAVYFQQGLNAVLGAYVVAYVIGLILAMTLTNSLTPYLKKLKKELPALGEARGLLKESVQIALFQAFVQLHIYISVFLLKAMSGNASAALFQAPFRVFNRIQIIPVICIPVLMPIFSRLFFAKKNDELRRTAETVFKSMLIISLLVTFFFASFADVLIPLLLGPDFNPSIQVFKILSFSTCFLFLNTIFNSLFIASQRTVLPVWIEGGGVVFCVLINILLIPHSGCIGSSWAIVISEGIVFVANCLFFVKIIPGIPVKAILTAIIGSGIGSLVASQVSGGRMLLAFLFGILVCLLLIFALRLACVDDIKKIYRAARQPST